jgi:hypothetical protein
VILLDVLYIGLPFSRWDYRRMVLQRHSDVAVTTAFKNEGCSIFSINAAENGAQICKETGWDSSFVQQTGVTVPKDFFLATQVYWEDYMLLYISSSAAYSSPEYVRFVNRAVEEAIGNGLVVAADVRGEAAEAPWADKATVVWDMAPFSPALSGDRLISIGIGLNDITIATRKGMGRFSGAVDGEQFMPVYLKSLLEGKSMADSVEAYTAIHVDTPRQ